MSASPTRSLSIDLRPRHRKFAFAGDVAEYWFASDPFRTRFFDALSTMLPVGERFFIDTLRRCEPEIEDHALRERVRRFIAQEANHQREHRRYNDRLRTLGYDIDGMDRSQLRVMAKILRLKSTAIPLAVTIALEHITAVLGASLLRGEIFESCEPEMVELWKWHAAEEIEHKAVAYDVYLAQGGGPHLRRVIMAWALFILSVRMLSRLTQMLYRDGRLGERKVWSSGLKFLLGSGGVLRAIGPEFLDFFRADFHPWDHDNYSLVETWDRERALAREG